MLYCTGYPKRIGLAAFLWEHPLTLWAELATQYPLFSRFGTHKVIITKEKSENRGPTTKSPHYSDEIQCALDPVAALTRAGVGITLNTSKIPLLHPTSQHGQKYLPVPFATSNLQSDHESPPNCLAPHPLHPVVVTPFLFSGLGGGGGGLLGSGAL
jgi:hypothetical protein